ncbi:MAG: Uma2 family endonuclease [Firmicutes bacterium]|nr:Uma2 family endonuclease [Bacillota bacterium]
MHYQEMAVFPRHGEILERIGDMLSVKYISEILSNKLIKYRENNALVYNGTYGCFDKSPPFELVNVNEKFLPQAELKAKRYIQPDYMIFHNNKYQKHFSTYKIAGCPDLIIEVWSKGNEAEDKHILTKLYATSPITEFWQIEQDSNEVLCSLGETLLPSQSLLAPLQTQGGLEIDLTSIALP